jgi:hypothetical protein
MAAGITYGRTGYCLIVKCSGSWDTLVERLARLCCILDSGQIVVDCFGLDGQRKMKRLMTGLG